MAYQEHLGRRYMENFALAHSVAHPVELMLALGCLLTGGIFQRFPGLKAAFLEGHCSWVPWWLWCLDKHVEKFGDKVGIIGDFDPHRRSHLSCPRALTCLTLSSWHT